MASAPPAARVTSRFEAGIARLCRVETDPRSLVRALAAQLRGAIPSDGLLLLRTDPMTVLPTDGVVEALPPALCKPFWDNELLEDDVNKFVSLARRQPPEPLAASLREATGGRPERSHRYRTIYQPLGFGDELRVSFTARDGSCWGVGQLMRAAGRPGGAAAYSGAERDLLAAVAPLVASALRARFALAPPAAAPQRGPALVILDKGGEIESITPEAREWLSELAEGSGTGMVPVPEPVYTVAGRARAARSAAGAGPACAQVRTVSRGWLHLHASYLDGPDAAGDLAGGQAAGSVAVVITPAQAPELMPLLALGYRLTHREQEVLRFLARGMSTGEITEQLGISPHTVRDHIKALFGKVGVRSRAELLARIFAEHYFDRLEADVDRVAEEPPGESPAG